MTTHGILYDIPVTTIRGQDTTLAPYRSSVLLIVNVASECGFTPQYADLERLYRAHADRGFVVLGFPCDQFGGQEPGTNAEIEAFCTGSYKITFPMFAKIEVKGPAAHPLYRWLTEQRPGMLGTLAIKWNFTKFLVDRNGTVVERYAPTTSPEQIEPAIVAQLG